ncbi:MAG: hypothetical protein M3541_15555 [Acidobacteriota bacterium]|nr:hypothetical protein [Acidobacteriota bacterium]
MQQTLFDVDSADPLIYLVVAVLLLVVAEFASCVPARRATRIDPVLRFAASDVLEWPG